MNTTYFRQLFYHYQKPDGADWDPADFQLVGTLRGYLQPTGGGMATEDGAISEVSTHRLYTQVNRRLSIGDELEDTTNKRFVVMYVTGVTGIAGRGDHDEVGLSLR